MKINIISPVQRQNLDSLLTVEREAWQSEGANITAARIKILHRIKSFPEGITLAIQDDGCPVGSQYSFRLNWDENPDCLTSWDELTACGWTNKVHRSDGNTGFLVGVGVVPSARRVLVTHNLRWIKPMRVSSLLIAKTLDNLFGLGAARVIANARVPHYHLRPDLSIEEYCHFRQESGELFDPVLRFHERMGARILKPVKYSLEDQESLNGGCWVLYQQPFEG